jgi:flagellar biosynthesis/type III secretory pathway M-ring protein FliF/YscJ
MNSAFVTVLAVDTGVVVIVVAVAVALVVLFVTVSMRGRQKRSAQRRSETRHELDQAEERLERAERGRDSAQEQVKRQSDPDR